MNQEFQGWAAVAVKLRERAASQNQLAHDKGEAATRLNPGQRASLCAIAARIERNGVLIADEVGMGKTRIAVEVASCVIECGGRVAILVPPGLGYQWQAELRDGGVNDVPPILRSLHAYLCAWNVEETENQRPWFLAPVVMISHALTNWRMGSNTPSWRWALVPELYARWRKRTDGSVPRGYHGNELLTHTWQVCRLAAESITAALPDDSDHPALRLLDPFSAVPWPSPLLDAGAYSTGGELRVWLEKCVGLGLGAFDLLVIDEAHKSRGAESGLSRLLEKVVLYSPGSRRLALTATPIELNVDQWSDTLGRLGLTGADLRSVQAAASQYAGAVKRVRQTWRSSSEGREAFKTAATHFQQALSPYLIRRDKREDPDVQQFQKHTGLQLHEYRRETEVAVKTPGLTLAWRKAICAAESLSVVTRQATDPVAKRLRLTLGNGHGIAALLDQVKRDEKDNKQEAFDEANRANEQQETVTVPDDPKRQERAEWWLKAIQRTFAQGDDSLFDHPAIQAAVEAIEQETNRGEKVLVFGKFTRPMRALVDLLNAREMLRRVQKDESWPQTKVHGDRNESSETSEWSAVRAAHRQLNSSVQLDILDETLRLRYERAQRQREQFRKGLVSRIEAGLKQNCPSKHVRAVFDAFSRSTFTGAQTERAEHHALAVVARALMELLDTPAADSSEYASAFSQLVEATSDRDSADDPDREVDEDEAAGLWEQIEGRLRDEYDRPQGGFARLMFGGTSAETRRMIQLAFNRPKSFPQVLVAQSLVGREGLNLHRACRIVLLLHPEWNPGVVEQQIGRVDRVDSHWCHGLKRAMDACAPADQTPRIEIRPVIFRGTYDEHNWQVLRTRWDDLRAQLHGVVIPPGVGVGDPEGQRLLEAVARAAPDFSPQLFTGRGKSPPVPAEGAGN